MFAQILTTVVLTVLGSLGYTVYFSMLEQYSAQRAAKKHNVGQFQQTFPLVIGVSALMLAMRIMNIAANSEDIVLYWALINLQLLMIMYTDLMINNIWAFLILKVVECLTFIETGGRTVILWLVLTVVGSALFFESHYAKNWSPDNPWLFAFPPLVIDASFWVLLWLRWHPTTVIVFGNFMGFALAMLVIFANGRSQRDSDLVVARLTHETQFDALSGVRNWAMFQHDLTQAYASASLEQPLGVMTFDLDHFKAINDTYGHLAGNATLKATASALDAMLQSHDPNYHVYRTGGEEFAVILPDTHDQLAQQIAMDALYCVRNLQIATEVGTLSITASFGLTQAKVEDRDATTTFKRADQALYLAKNAGRNRFAIDETIFGA
jgi:diguanylate cyclase (GGDEF)-like protein